MINPSTDPSRCLPVGECIPCNPSIKEHASICQKEGTMIILSDCLQPTEEADGKSEILRKFVLCQVEKPPVNSLQSEFSFFKFEAFNFAVALIAFGVIVWRRRKARSDQYQRLMREFDS